MSAAELIVVHPSCVPAIWPRVEQLVVGAITRTDLCHTLDVVPKVMDGTAQLWLAIDGKDILAAATTLLRRTDKHLICELTALGGRDRPRWLPMLDQIEAWAKAEGATALRFFGRRGWTRVLKNYRTRHVILEKTL